MRSDAVPRFGRPGAFAKVRSCALLALLLASVAPALDVSGAKDAIRVEDAWIRWLPANLPSGGYATVTNTGSVACVLTGANSPDYGDVSFHQTRNSHGMNQMRPVDTITVQPHSTIRFAEGGYHLMLMQPKRSLRPGDRVSVTFRLSNEQAITASFEVRVGS